MTTKFDIEGASLFIYYIWYRHLQGFPRSCDVSELHCVRALGADHLYLNVPWSSPLSETINVNTCTQKSCLAHLEVNFHVNHIT